MCRLACSISEESLRRDSRPLFQDSEPRVEMYFAFREVWAGVRDMAELGFLVS